jgi:integrase
VYIERIKLLKTFIKETTLYDAIANPEDTYAKIADKTLSARAKMVSTILAVIKYNVEAFENVTSIQSTWREYKAHINAELAKQKEDGLLTQREAQSFMAWSEILRMASQVTDTWDKLLVSMYTLIPPARNDYCALAITYDEAILPKTGNYMIVRGDSSIEMVLRHYKTCKTYGVYKKLLPPCLVDIITTSLHQHPRPWLFPNRRHYDMPMTKNNMINWMKKRFLHIFNKAVTINTLRHSFITSINFNASTPAQLLGYAKDMHHSYTEQLFYRRFIEEETSDTSECTENTDTVPFREQMVTGDSTQPPTAASYDGEESLQSQHPSPGTTNHCT